MSIHNTYRAVVDKTHELIIKFRDKANDHLKQVNSSLVERGESPVPYFWYSGQFISGDICEPKTLILSLNPGGGSPEPLKPCYFRPRNSNGSELKYFDEYKADYQFAKNLVKYIFDEEIEMLRACAETYAYSPFASPGIEGDLGINKSLRALSRPLNEEHHYFLATKIVVEAIKHLNPKNIIIVGAPIGKGAWNFFVKKMKKADPSFTIKPKSGSDYEADLEYGRQTSRIFACQHLSRGGTESIRVAARSFLAGSD